MRGSDVNAKSPASSRLDTTEVNNCIVETRSKMKVDSSMTSGLITTEFDNYDDKSPNTISNLTVDVTLIPIQKPQLCQKMSIGSDHSSSTCCSDTSRSSTADIDKNFDHEEDFRTFSSGSDEDDDIIEKIRKLQFEATDNLNVKTNYKTDNSSIVNDNDNEFETITSNTEDPNSNYFKMNIFEESENKNNVSYKENITASRDDNASSDEDNSESNDNEDVLISRGPMKSQGYSYRCEPYDQLRNNSETQYPQAAPQQTQNYGERINTPLDVLSTENLRSDDLTIDWDLLCFSQTGTYDEWNSTNSPSNSVQTTNTSLPPTDLTKVGQADLMELFQRGNFQTAQTISDTASNSTPSPAQNAESWADSPGSNYNLIQSRPGSRSSNCDASPPTSDHVGDFGSSPLATINVYSSNGSPQVASPYRVHPGFSPSSSSSQSCCETPSPGNYQSPFDQRLDQPLTEILNSLRTPWQQEYESSDMVVNGEIDIDKLRQVEEAIITVEKKDGDELQVVPVMGFDPYFNKADNALPYGNGREESTLFTPPSTGVKVPEEMKRNTGAIIREAQKSLDLLTAEDTLDFYVGVEQRQSNAETMNAVATTGNGLHFETMNVLDVNYSFPLGKNMCIRQGTPNVLAPPTTASTVNYTATTSDATQSSSTNLLERSNYLQLGGGTTRIAVDPVAPSCSRAAESTTKFNDFQIPETVSQYRSSGVNKSKVRSILPWPSLNLPSTSASERLKEKLDPRKVKRAMANLLNWSPEDLARRTEDDYTMLMRLVDNPEELEKNLAYLVPLVERLSNIQNSLTAENSRRENALYLAAMKCPSMPYVTGYLGAVMLRQGIVIPQGDYHNRADTLIHAVAAMGDSHGAVLAELLALRTKEGNPVFDLSRYNYKGRTPLHVAVEKHDPIGRGVSTIGIVRLLLENGANPKIQATQSGDTALHMAVSLIYDPNLVRALLTGTGGQAVNVKNYSNNTPLHMAAAISRATTEERQYEICRLLIRCGGMTNIQNRQGKTPLALVDPKRKEAIRMIFQKKF